MNTFGGTINLLQDNQSRAAALDNIGPNTLSHHTCIIIVTNEAVGYIAAGIGSPTTIYNLIVYTSSSNTWVGASTPYI